MVMLTQHQTSGFRKILDQRFLDERARVHQTLLQSDRQSYAELAGQVHDSEDAALADLPVDASLADIDRHIEEIRAIDAALLRIANGSYGRCSRCGEAIDVLRPQAAPTAQRCVPCQTSHENRGRTVHSTSL
jgi:DnaK suppressor protein